MWPSGLGGGAARGNSGDLAGVLGRGVAGEDLGVERARSGCSLATGTGPAAGRGGGHSGDRWRSDSSEPRPGLDNQRVWELQGVLVVVGAARVCGESGRSQGFTVGTKTAAKVAWQCCAPAR
jgi:hypothetical protein